MLCITHCAHSLIHSLITPPLPAEQARGVGPGQTARRLPLRAGLASNVAGDAVSVAHFPALAFITKDTRNTDLS